MTDTKQAGAAPDGDGVVDMDFREIEPGSMLDLFHFEMWVGMPKFLIGRNDVLAAFEAGKAMRFVAARRNGLEEMIDKACGVDLEAENAGVMAEFARWATDQYWGGPEYCSPAIIARLSPTSPGAT